MTFVAPVPPPPGEGFLPPCDALLVAGIGEMIVSADQASDLIAYGLGSCVALSAWDPSTKIAGVAHFMLPSGRADGSSAKFVDTGLPIFLRAFEAHGGTIRRAEFKAAGGAAMLAFNASALEIGRRNAETLEQAIATHGLRLLATDFGGSSGRTVQLEVLNGRLHVKSVSRTSVL
jgi:chemotaxis protein CheD